MLYCFCCKRIG